MCRIPLFVGLRAEKVNMSGCIVFVANSFLAAGNFQAEELTIPYTCHLLIMVTMVHESTAPNYILIILIPVPVILRPEAGGSIWGLYGIQYVSISWQAWTSTTTTAAFFGVHPGTGTHAPSRFLHPHRSPSSKLGLSPQCWETGLPCTWWTRFVSFEGAVGEFYFYTLLSYIYILYYYLYWIIFCQNRPNVGTQAPWMAPHWTTLFQI